MSHGILCCSLMVSSDVVSWCLRCLVMSDVVSCLMVSSAV